MRLTELVYNLIENFAPMSEKSAVELRTDAQEWYNKTEEEAFCIAQAKEKNSFIDQRLASDELDETEKEVIRREYVEVPKEGIQHKIVTLSEKWYVRTFFAIAFIGLHRWIQDFMNPSTKGKNETDDDDDEYDD